MTASEALHQRATAWIEAYATGRDPVETFDSFGTDLLRHQLGLLRAFARLVDPNAPPERVADAPAIPTDAFKHVRIATFPEHETVRTFRTSGTTIGRRGEHFFRDTSTYARASVAFARRTLLASWPERVSVIVLGPPPSELPDSSLTFMFEEFVRAFGFESGEDETYFVRDGIIDLEALDRRIAREVVRERGPILVLGTSFAFVHLLDALDGATLPLPEGSRVMQTGGFKGKSRSIPAHQLVTDVSSALGIPTRQVVSEYGMTELSSQFYEQLCLDPNARRGVYVEPPWARVRAVHPESLEPVPDGEIGIARIEDLLNIDSACVVLTQDRVRHVPGGFELLGRADGAPPRGCSIALDEILGAGPRGA